jgi:tripartite-type tricarboxylate transporter receptor subunit TctC
MKTSLRKAATPRRRTASRNNDRRLASQHPRRRFLSLAAGAAVLPAVSRMSWAQAYPARPITMIVPFAAGGPADVVARVVAERMRRTLGKPIIVENIGGADGNIGVGRAVRARPDGYTIEFGDQSSHVLNGALYSLPYDLLKDFVPVAPLVTIPRILFARKTIPANDLRELIEWLKANPNNASAAVSSAGYRLIMALFQKETGTRFSLVPYRGLAPAMQDLVAEHIDMALGSAPELSLMRLGIINAYAIAGDTRLAQALNIPTFSEMGLPTLSFPGWFGLFAPKGTPSDIIRKLNAAAVEAVADPAMRSRLIDIGVEVFPHARQTPEALGALVKADAEKWWPIIKEFGIKAE